MKRLFCAGVMVSLLVPVASNSWAASNLNLSKSNVNRVAGKEGGQGEGKQSTAAPAAQGQQDPCANVKNDPNQYAKCQDATHQMGLKQTKGRKGY